MRTKTNRTLRKILSIALCLALVMSYVPMVSITAGAVVAADITVTIDTGDEVTLQDTNGDYYYEIGTADELYAFAAAVNGGEPYIYGKLTADIVVNQNVLTVDGELNGDGSNFRVWTPIGSNSCSYAGTFDGDGKSISGLYFNESTTNYVGLFGYLYWDGTVENIGVIDSYFNGSSYIGGVVAYIYGGTVQNCYNTGIVSGRNYHIGGVVGYIYEGGIENCYNTGSVSGSNNVGGVAGYNDGAMQRCYNTGKVSGNAGIGGGVGYSGERGTVMNCYNTGQVSGNNQVGGVVGNVSGSDTVTNCYNTGIVSGSGYNIGGVVGNISGSTNMTNCYNTGIVSSSGYNIGGVVGKVSGIVKNCYYLSDNETDDIDETTAKNEAQFASGEVAYLLNGFTSEGVWKQSIGTDAAPNFIGKTVFYGYISCTDTARSYSNEALFADKPHNYENGTCSVCGEVCSHTDGELTYTPTTDGTQHIKKWSCCSAEVTEDHSTTADGDKAADCNSKAYCAVCESEYGDVALTKHDETVEYENGLCPNGCYEPAVLNADGYYEIGNVGNLFWLAQQVNYGSLTKFNAVLTSDLIIPDSKQWMPINLPDGIQNASVFDGNGHSITLNQSSGLFGSFNYSVFRNVILYGTVTANTTGNIGAVVGSAYRTTIQNVISYVDVTNSNGNAGGLAGYFGGKHSDEMYSKIENCAVYADISGTNTGGLIGEGWNGTQYFDIANCTYVGDITGTNAGAIVGYQNTDSNTCVFTNIYWCEADGIGFYGKRDTSNQVYTNTMEKTPEQFASGEVAYLLQQGNTEQVWGQDNNQTGAKPMFTSNELYKVVTVGGTGNYSVANVGDTNGDGTVDVTDYQALVNKALADDHEQIETASYDDIVKYDLDGDGYLDVIDAYLIHLFINGFTTVDVYAVGDYDLNGVAFEEADIKAIKHAIENPEKLATYKKYASDINGDGKLDENDLTVLTAKYGEVTGTECADNVKVYYRWGNKYSTCTATAMCTLCGEKVATETVNTTSETLSESTCTQDGKVKYTAIFENELFEEKIKTVTTDMLPHNLSDGVCTVCGIIDATNMTADELETAVTELLLAGKTNITVALAEDAEQEMFSAIRTAFLESTAADGSINLTISGAKTVPEYGFFDNDNYFANGEKNIAGDKLKSLTLTDVETIGDFAFSACTYLESVNLPQVVTIGECAFNEWKKGTKLTSLDLPNATTIGDWAFAYSSLLTSVNLPKVTSIGVLAFGYCDLRTLDLPEATTIGGEAFMNNYNLVSCSAPKATTIDYYPWGSNGTSKLERLELTAAGDFMLGNNLYAYTPTEQIDLVLNKDKESQVTQNEDGTATWATTNRYGGSLTYIFKSITFVGE